MAGTLAALGTPLGLQGAPMGPNLTMGLEEELVRLEPSSKAMLHDPGVIKTCKNSNGA